MPKEKKNILKFKNYHKQLKAPFVIYADFESIVKPINERFGESTRAYQHHKACGYGLNLVCTYDNNFSKPVQMYRGEDSIYKFIEQMLKEEEYCKELMEERFDKEMIITQKEQKEFDKSTFCHICGREYIIPWDYLNNPPIRDHCHVTGLYRGSTYNSCNQLYRFTKKIPVIFHNFKGHDGHLIMQEICKFKKDINVIPNNMENYMSFMISDLVFIDSLQFLNQSLFNSVNNLPDT